jgi:hypothetical protein
MVHFTREDWKAFAKGQVVERKHREMEQHLMVCDACAEKYLSFFSEKNAACPAVEISPQFTSNVMKRINGLEVPGRKERSKKRDIFYYCAAACLTIFFTSAGVFEGFAEVIPAAARTRIQAEHSFETGNISIIKYGWSDRLLNNTLTFIDAIKPKGEEEVVH